MGQKVMAEGRNPRGGVGWVEGRNRGREGGDKELLPVLTGIESSRRQTEATSDILKAYRKSDTRMLC